MVHRAVVSTALAGLGGMLGAVLATAFALPALAYPQAVVVTNGTSKCAFISVYEAGKGLPWELPLRLDSKPRYVKPGENYRFFLNRRPELKVRAEVTRYANCTGGELADVSNRNSDVDHTRDTIPEASLVEREGDFHVQWTKLH
jgi:hypothetical protein